MLYGNLPLNDDCNLDCSYCYFSHDYSSRLRMPREEWENFVRFFTTRGGWAIGLNGKGEPFFHPDFVEIAARLTSNCNVSFSTNLTHDLEEFARNVPPERIGYINASLQIAMEKQLDVFIERLRFLKDKGYAVSVSFLMAPSRINRFEEMKRIIENKTGVSVYSLTARGVIQGKVYPDAYTDEQKRLIIGNVIHAPYASGLFNGFINYSTHKICNRGNTVFHFGNDGNIYRCQFDTGRAIGNVHENRFDPAPDPYPCTLRTCLTMCLFTDDMAEYADGCGDFREKSVDEKIRMLEQINDLSGPVDGYADFWRERERRLVTSVIDSLRPRLEGKRIAIRPGGVTASLVFETLPGDLRENVVAVIDKNSTVAQARFPGMRIVPPEQAGSLDCDVLLVLSERFQEQFLAEAEPIRKRGADIIVNPFPSYDSDGFKVF